MAGNGSIIATYYVSVLYTVSDYGGVYTAAGERKCARNLTPSKTSFTALEFILANGHEVDI